MDCGIVETFDAGCNVAAPLGATLLYVLVRDGMGKHAGYMGIVALPSTRDSLAYDSARQTAAKKVANGGRKMTLGEARERWRWLTADKYRA